MIRAFFGRGLALALFFSVGFSVAPHAVLAYSLATPTDLEVVGGKYTNDTTPTFSWDRSSGATWYSYTLDTNEEKTLGNVDTYTASTLSDGWHTFFLRARDNDGRTSSTTSVTFEIDTVGPTVPSVSVSSSSVSEGESVTISVYPSGESAATSCTLYVAGSNEGSMTKNGTTFYMSYTFSRDGSYSVYARCTDGDGNTTSGTARTISVSHDDNDDEDSFTVPSVTPSSATEDTSVTFKVTPYGDLDAETCKLYVDGSSVGTMSESSSGTFTKSYTFAQDGDYAVYAYCEDEDGDWHWGTSRNVSVEDEDDMVVLYDFDEDFIVPAVTPSTATEDISVTFKVTPYGYLDAETCKLYVDGSSVGTMSESSSRMFSKSHVFTNDGSYKVYAYCEDEDGDWTRGTSRTVTVEDRDDDDRVSRGSLIKTACSASSRVSDPCRAVYYYGKDGDRHAFPNETTFFTWFADFDDVVEVSESFMASLDMGRNVTYRPGSVLVKFSSSAKVYAIEADRTLRHYESESLVRADYGSDWGTVLMHLSDSLYGNYQKGSSIDSKYDFDRTEAYYSVDSIEDIF